jgi:uncharacterized protein YqgC (DUF456 family)
MEWVIIVLGILLAVAGVAGSLLPALPGPPIAYAGLWLQQLRDPNPFTLKFLLLWGALTLATMILDYYVPIWGTKKFGGTKYGVWGCTLGFLAAFWMGPMGVIIGPFVGAFLGELLARQNSANALKAAIGSFVGFLTGSFLKLLVCFFMIYYIVASI